MTNFEAPREPSGTPYTEPVFTAGGSTGIGTAPPSYGASAGGPSPSAKDKASDAADAGKQAVSDVAGTAQSKAQDVVAETKTQARQVVGEAQDQFRAHAKEQHRNAVTNLHALGDELGSMAQRSEHPGPATDLVGQASSRAHSAASWLEQREPGDLIGELRSLAGKRPGAFLVGALAAGLVAGRLTRGVVAVHKDDSDDNGNLDTTTDLDTGVTTDYRAPLTAPAQSGYVAGPGPSDAAPLDSAYQPGQAYQPGHLS